MNPLVPPPPRRLYFLRYSLKLPCSNVPRRSFSGSGPRRRILDVSSLPARIVPSYDQTPTSSLLSLRWPRPPRNILLVPKLYAPQVLSSAVDFARHIHGEYPGLNLVFEQRIAESIHAELPFPIYTTAAREVGARFPEKIDLVTTLGGDGTILRAASLFSMQASVPPILSFSMGSLGFLGEWKFDEYKRAWREAYMSGSDVAAEDLAAPHTQAAVTTSSRSRDPGASTTGAAATRDTGLEAWERVRGKSMGLSRSSKILLRHRLKVGIYDTDGVNINEQVMPTSTTEPDLRTSSEGGPGPTTTSGRALSPDATRGPDGSIHAINEVSIDRGAHPHLAIIDIYINNAFLTEAVADGIIISTPTGSTAYSLSAGGSIVHPLVKSLLITPISARSLSFRPLVLPLNSRVVLRLSKRNRGRELPVSIDGKRRTGVGIGMEIRIEGENLIRTGDGTWQGGVPCVIRAPAKPDANGVAEDDDSWVGGLNGLLKFNYPFGEV